MCRSVLQGRYRTVPGMLISPPSNPALIIGPKIHTIYLSLDWMAHQVLAVRVGACKMTNEGDVYGNYKISSRMKYSVRDCMFEVICTFAKSFINLFAGLNHRTC